MDPLLALAIVGALVAATTAAGLAWRAAQGRVRRVGTTDAVAVEGVELAPGATLLQFSSEYCAPCRATARVLADIVDGAPDLAHVEVDVAERPDLAARFDVLQTPTTLVLDSAGRPRARIAGAVRAEQLRAELDRLAASRTTVPA
ncbi:thioredoxin family protein [Protaetiibacter sp. SSC-01]|uniref:thioredoxin family protein n=1 Tax=Protaetiibacter sp. SSC-01 TaxID=2759943 RepID=UPI001656A7B7|nr:thioredoxin family protein [Protaetiibacter sp. SSC-01]QNO36613.1 thioredoxin family protein [Protaetiibacter sp. SSC-01]